MITKKNLYQVYNRLIQNKEIVNSSSIKSRINNLKNLKKTLLSHRNEIKEALFKDFKKNSIEADLTEIFPVISEINFNINNLLKWNKKKYVKTPLTLVGSKSYLKYEPKGLVLILTPWNFPINLSLVSLVSAIAAGNSVILKPSEITSNTSIIIKKIINTTFNENEVATVLGGVDVAEELLRFKFDHILFIGSPTIGKKVMKSAAENLSSITLELGGKSPTIIDRNINLKKAAKRVVWAKFINNGQVCIAPDYIFVHHGVKVTFINFLIKYIKEFYSEMAINSSSYCRIVNKSHFNRIKNLLEDAINKKSKILYGGKINSQENYIEPTLLENISEKSKIFDEEIFGPILPVFEYKEIEEVISFINKKEKPLALYIYSKSKKNINKILEHTSSGGVCINHSTLHYSNNNLPFGGVGNSGFGRCHGEYGFKEFSNTKSIFEQFSSFSPSDLLVPPYNNLKKNIVNFLIKYL